MTKFGYYLLDKIQYINIILLLTFTLDVRDH